jgi:PAS domain S-box-containing protein
MPDIRFLEGEFDRAIADRQEPAASNVVGFNGRPEASERERRFRLLLDALPTAVYTTDAQGRVTYFNDAAIELWGHRPELGTAEWCGSWKLYDSGGAPMPHDRCPMAIALRENRKIRGDEAVAERPDGTRVPFAAYPTPLHDQSGSLIGAVNTMIDLTDRKRAEAEQAMLMREVHHRVRNTLAIAQAIVGSTAKSSETIEGFKDALIGRISALARTHLLLSDSTKTSVPFGIMVHNELDPFDDSSGARVVIEGPDVEVSSRQAVPLGMVLHELTTNSAKYGALSTLGGRVDAIWRIVIEANHRTLSFDWIESGGPMVTAPLRKGFGSQLLEAVIPRQIHGDARIDYRPDGVRIAISLPLPPEPPEKAPKAAAKRAKAAKATAGSA